MRGKNRRMIMCLAMGLLGLAEAVSAEEQPASPASEEAQFESAIQAREPRRWNASFIYGSTTFYDSEAHRTFGATFRIRLANRLSVEPEVRYMSVPSFESTNRRTVWKHSDLMVAGHVVYDFRDEAEARFVPYVMGGAGWMQTRNESTSQPIVVENPIPVFPTPPPPQSSTRKTVTNWLWLGGGFGLRIVLPQGFFVSPELRLGGSMDGDLSASAVFKMGYGF